MRYNPAYIGNLLALCGFLGHYLGMEAETFCKFLSEYRATYGPIKDCRMADRLGISADTFTRMKQRGTSNSILAYACSALMHNLDAYGDGKR